MEQTCTKRSLENMEVSLPNWHPPPPPALYANWQRDIQTISAFRLLAQGKLHLAHLEQFPQPKIEMFPGKIRNFPWLKIGKIPRKPRDVPTLKTGKVSGKTRKFTQLKNRNVSRQNQKCFQAKNLKNSGQNQKYFQTNGNIPDKTMKYFWLKITCSMQTQECFLLKILILQGRKQAVISLFLACLKKKKLYCLCLYLHGHS